MNGFGRQRKRGKVQAEQQSILPTIYDHHDDDVHAMPPTCNNFLLGGQFYPGKDKYRRRRHMKRALWFRIFCSSPLRSFLTVLLLAYLLVWHAIVPLSSRLIFYAHVTPNNRLPESISSLIPSKEERIKRMKDLQRERNRIEQKNGFRKKILENIAPAFFHRNSPVQESSEDKQSGDSQDEPRVLKNMDSFKERSACNNETNSISTTLVIQATLDRAWILHETCKRWTDPIVAVIGIHEEENDEVDHVIGPLEQIVASECAHLKLIRYPIRHPEPEMYPVNHMRNLGLDSVKTSHILVVDVDFVPSLNLQDSVRTVLKERAKTTNEAIIVPAFERILPSNCSSEQNCAHLLQYNDTFIPHTFEDLKDCYDREDCDVFQKRLNWEGHHSTRSEKWLQKDWYETGTSPRTLSCFDSLRYEPYVVLRWCPERTSRPIAPYYDERFYGYGKNKIEYIQHIRMMGYSFAVLPGGFIVHNPHPESKSKMVWNDAKKSLHKDMDHLYPKFLRELMTRYEDQKDHVIRQCQ